MSSVGMCEIDGVDIRAVEGFRGGGGSDLRWSWGNLGHENSIKTGATRDQHQIGQAGSTRRGADVRDGCVAE